MSDDQETLRMQAVGTEESDAQDRAEQEPTDEFQVDDVDASQATRRLESSQLTSIQSSAQAHAAVPGKNSTLPLPAVTASKTMTSPVPEAVLDAMRSQAETVPTGRAISGVSIVKDDEIESTDQHAETVERSPPVVPDDGPTEESFPAVSFFAEIDGDGRVFIPRKYMGLLRYGQKVAVRVQAVPADDN